MRSRLSRFWCALFGHDWTYLPAPPGYMSGRIGGPRKCDCCGVKWKGVKYPPMPPCAEGRPLGPMTARGYQPREAVENPNPPPRNPNGEPSETIKQGLTELRAERKELERRLNTLISKEVAEFGARTGASIASVEVGMVEHHELGVPKRWVVGYVSVDTPLD